LAKLSIQRLLEVSKLIATEAGGQLEEAITFLNDLANQTTKALRNGLSFRDNFNCLVQEAELRHDVEAVLNTSGKRPAMIIPGRVISTNAGLDSFAWYINEQNQTIVKVKYSGTTDVAQKCVFIILFEF
jgi:hypothetical protein